MFDRAVAIVEGYLGDDPVERKTQSGKTKVSLSIGINKSYKNPKTDEWESSTDWHKIIVVNPNLVEKALKCKKGAYVRAEGNLEKRSSGFYKTKKQKLSTRYQENLKIFFNLYL
jgi:single-stranded DNA-binding protein